MERQEIILRAIPGLSEEDIKKYTEIYQDLVDRGLTLDKVSRESSKSSGYSMDSYKGVLKTEYKGTLSPLQISMLCDNGFSHFGGTSTLYKNGSYSVMIYKD